MSGARLEGPGTPIATALVLASLIALLMACFTTPALALARATPLQAGGEQVDFSLEDAYWSLWVGRGMNNTFSVVLEYLATQAASAINATLNVTSLSPGTALLNDSYPGPLVRGQTVTFSFEFLVPENATASHYNLTLSLEYLRGGEERARDFLVQATVMGTPDLAASCDSWELKRLVANNVTLRIRNEGDGVARAIRVELNPQSPYLIIIGPNVFERDLLWVGEEWAINLTVFVEAGADRASSIRLTASYYDQRGRPYGLNVALGFEVSGFPGPDLEIKALNESLRPNSLNNLTLRVENIGREDAWNVTVSLFSYVELISIVGASEFRRSLLRPGEAWEFTVLVFVQPRVYGAVGLYALMSYEDPRGSGYTESTQIGLEVAGEASLAISKVVCWPPTVVPGDRYVALMVILTNVGDYVARDVKLRLEPVPGLVEPSYAGAEEAMIPYLPMGYPANVTFLVDVAEEAKPGFYELPLSVSHDDSNYTLLVPFCVREKASFEVVGLEFSPWPSPGSRGVRMTIELRNVANVTAEQVRISIISAYIRGVTAVLLGDLMGGETRIAVLEVDFDEATPINLVFELQISWYQGERSLTCTLRQSITLSQPSRWPDVREVAIWLGFLGLGAAITFAVMKLRRGVF